MFPCLSYTSPSPCSTSQNRCWKVFPGWYNSSLIFTLYVQLFPRFFDDLGLHHLCSCSWNYTYTATYFPDFHSNLVELQKKITNLKTAATVPSFGDVFSLYIHHHSSDVDGDVWKVMGDPRKKNRLNLLYIKSWSSMTTGWGVPPWRLPDLACPRMR